MFNSTVMVERMYSRLPEALRVADETNGYALKKFLSSVGDIQDAVDQLIARFEYLAVDDRPMPWEESLPYVAGTIDTEGNIYDEDGNLIPVVTNLATNPSFEATSGTVEVRRNYSALPHGASSYQIGTGEVSVGSTETSGGPFEGIPYTRRTITTPKTGGTSGFYSYPNAPVPGGVALGTSWMVSVYVRLSIDTEVSLSVTGRDGSTMVGSATSGPYVSIPAGQWTRVPVLHVANANSEGIGWWLTMHSGAIVPAEGTIDVTAVLVEAGSVLRPYFDGARQAEPDMDFIESWLSTVGSSASILTASGVVGASSTLASFANVSSRRFAASGSKSVRTIPKGASNDTRIGVEGDTAGMRLGMEAGKTYTALAVIHLEAEQTGALHSQARRISFWYRNPSGYASLSSDAAPNTAGTYLLRHVFTVPDIATEAFIRLYNGASAGGGEVWWDDFALIEGEYDGPWFDGHTDNSVEYVYRWLTEKDASTSVRTPTGRSMRPSVLPARPVGKPLGTTSDLVDGDTAEAAWLPWIAQLFGVDSSIFSNESDLRNAVVTGVGGYTAGSTAALKAAVQSELTGTRYVGVYPSTTATSQIGGGTEWDVLIVSRETETPPGADLVAAAIRNRAKPAGVMLHQKSFSASWDVVETNLPTWNDWEGKTWTEIEETGF